MSNYLIKKHVRRTKKKTHSGKEDRDERSRPQKSLLRNSSVLELRSRRTIRRRKPNPICRHIYLLKNAHPEAVNVDALGPGIHRLPSTFMPSVFRGITRLDLITSQNLTLLFQWLQREYASLCADSDNIGITNWSVDSGPPPRTSMPTQENSYDCGVFECLYVAHITIQKPFTFTQTDINDVRLWMAENRTEAIGGEDPRLHQISKKVLVDMP